jgi:DNA polymerase III subunit delta
LAEDRRISARSAKNEMIIFLYGENLYEANREVKNIVEARINPAHGQKKAKYALRVFNEEELDFQSVKNELETGSLFDDKKIVVLKNIFADKTFKEEFFKNAEKFLKQENIILIFQEGSADKRDGLFKFLLKEADCREFLPLEDRELSGWIKKEFEKYKTQSDAKAIDELVLYVGNNMWQLENEIIKLSSYSKNSVVTEKEVRLLVKPKIENDIFATIECLAQKNKEKALYLIHKHLEKGDSPLYILTMINFQLRNLLEIKDLMERKVLYCDMAGKSRLHPFVVRKTYAQAQKFSLPQLKKIYQKIFQADLSIKTGKIEPETALDLLISGV